MVVGLLVLLCVLMAATLFLVYSKQGDSGALVQLSQGLEQLSQQLVALKEQAQAAAVAQQAHQQHQQQDNQRFRERFDQHQLTNLKTLQESLRDNMLSLGRQTNEALAQQSKRTDERIGQLTESNRKQLESIQTQVDKRLDEGFEKTRATFTDVVKRLAIIDQAQQKITELSGNVVGLKDLLSDKRARGAFGEVQLASLIRDMIPEQHLAFQHTFSNGKRVDCALFLPEPTGTIAIDAKFPLESYQRSHDPGLGELERQRAGIQFKQDIKKHINDIASKYILPGETADGAMMFLPSEAIFADIHTHHPELIHIAQQKRVWLVSPTTMMAVITTASAVLKDAATREQVNVIQQHLVALSQDFTRFSTRMDQLAKHIEQAHKDVSQVHTSSKKIVNRFQKIEQVELHNQALEPLFVEGEA